jgi:hypothetical protein
VMKVINSSNISLVYVILGIIPVSTNVMPED